MTVTIDKSEFDDFAALFAEKYDVDVSENPDAGGKQVVYEFKNPDHPDGVVARVFSSINDPNEYGGGVAGKSRAEGFDSIKTTLWYTKRDYPMAGRSHTKRTSGWRNRLEDKLSDLLFNQRVQCPECNSGVLVIRQGEFFGCTGYPDCEYTDDLS